MSDQPNTPEDLAPEPARRIRGDDGDLSSEYVAAVAGAVEAEDTDRLTMLAGDLYFADAADLLEALPAEWRVTLIRRLGERLDFAALTHLDETLRLQLLEALPPAEIARRLATLDSDDAVYILEALDEPDRAAILAQIPAVDRLALTRSLEYPDETAGRRMQTAFIAVPPFWTVGQTIDYMREAKSLPEDFHEVFVVDPGFRVVGTVQLNRLLRSGRPMRMSVIMDPTRQVVRATDDLEEVARLFERYDLVSAAVVDEADRLAGILTIDDMVDVIEEAADEDIRRLGGVGDEDISDSILTSSRSRLPWLAINTVTAFLAAGVIGFFEGTIAQMVALAVLMPIVATLGGNTGTQAMTVTVRAIATRELGRRNVRRIVLREVAVGLLNGVAIALLVGLGAGLWYADPELGVVIGLALMLNMLLAGLIGVLVPLTLNRFKLDPAVASGVFVTAATDVFGFFAFLGLAAWWFGLL